MIIRRWTAKEIRPCDKCGGPCGASETLQNFSAHEARPDEYAYALCGYCCKQIDPDPTPNYVYKHCFVAKTSLFGHAFETYLESTSNRGPAKIVGKLPEGPCRTCARPNDVGIKKCWWCETPNPC